MLRAFAVWLVPIALVAGACQSGTNEQTLEVADSNTPAALPTPEPSPEPTAAPEAAETAAPPPLTTPTATATPVPPPEPVEIRVDGIGPAAFGEPATTAVPALITIFGEPVSDESWTGESPHGLIVQPPPGDPPATLRVVTWDGLSAAFIDTPHFRDDRVLHLIGSSASGGSVPPLVTAEGLRVGSTLAELLAVRPDSPPYVSNCPERWHALLAGPIFFDGGQSDSAMAAVFDELTVPEGYSPSSSNIPLPPGAEEAVITRIVAGDVPPGC